jgi:tetratricopeptide (TPR) repeat protein
MSHLRASGRSHRAALLGAVLCVALSACSDVARHHALDQPGSPRVAESVLTPAQARRAQALAEYATGISDEIRGDLDGALDRYLEALQLDPQNTRLAVRLGQIYVSKRNLTNAVNVLETSLKAVPNSPEVSYWLGFAYRADNQDDKAATAFRQALKADRNNLNALGGLIDIYMQKDSFPEVNKLLDRAFRRSSDVSTYWMRLGDIYVLISKQKPTWAAKIDRKRIQSCYEKALALAPDDADLVMRVADAYADNGDFKKAAEAYAKLLAKQPDAPQVRERLALNYIRADQKEKAAAILEEIIKREPLHFGIYNYLAEIYEDLNQDEKAISNYQQSVVINPNQLLPYLRLALLQMKLKQFDAAAKTLNATKEKFPATYFVPYYCGLLYSEQKEYSKAVPSFADAEALATAAPDEVKLDGRFYFYYGAACERAGDFDKAVSLFRKCIQLDPENDGACNYLGFMWADKGVHLEEALDLIQKAIKLDPNNGAYIDSFGWVLFKLGRTDEALVQLQRAVTVTKDDAVVFDHLADVLLKLGKTDEALLALRRAKELDPDNKGISEKLQKLNDNQSAAH